MNPETRYTGLAALLLGLVVLVGSAESGFAQDLVPDDPTALGERFPLILIHGWCGNEGTWDSFRQFFTASPALASRFKLYSFNFPTGPGQVPIPICPNVNSNHTVERVRLLARHLKEVALPGIEGLIPGREIALLAHSLGGLIARSYLQEYEISHPPLVVITLATPHHGTNIAADFDPTGLLTSLYWDRYDESNEAQNDWLRCLNGLPENSLTVQGCSTFTATTERRLAVVPKLVTMGVTGQNSLDPRYPDDGVVPVQSALFDLAEPPVKRRYRGEGGFGAGSTCRGSFFPHSAIHEPNCLVAEEPASGRGLEDVFTVVERELLETVLELSPDKATVSVGDTLTLSMTNGADSRGDLYLAVRLPGGFIYAYDDAGWSLIWDGEELFASSLRPLRKDVTFPKGSEVILSITITEPLPPGFYTFLALRVRTGSHALDPGSALSNLAQVSATFVGAPRN
jgi:hypothetical protein